MTPTAVSRREAALSRLPLLAVAGFAAVSVVTGLLAWATSTGPDVPGDLLDGPAWLDDLFRGDSGWYLRIVTQGYSYTPGAQSPIAFFPAYPLLVHVVALPLGGDVVTAQGVTTLLCAAGAVALFADLARRRLAPRAAVVAVALLLLYPYSFFLYGSGYGDATFLLTALGAFALLERRRYLFAALVGAVATAGRPIGVAVTAGLVVRAVELIAQDRAARSADGDADRPVPLRALLDAVRDVRWREAALLLSAAGLVSWMVYLGVRFGDPVAFATVQAAPGWNQGSGPMTWFKADFVGSVLWGPRDITAQLVPQALVALLAVLLVRPAWRRLGWGYATYAAVCLAIPLIGTKDFMGTGRYVLSAFPLVLAAGAVLADDRRPRRVASVVLVVLAAGLAVAVVAFVRGAEVS